MKRSPLFRLLFETRCLLLLFMTLAVISFPIWAAESSSATCDLKFSASLGGCDNVYSAWFTHRTDGLSVRLTYFRLFYRPDTDELVPAPNQQSLVIDLPGSARNYSLTGVGCDAHFRVTVSMAFHNGEVCSDTLADNHNRHCSDCGTITIPAGIVNAANFRGQVTADSIASLFSEQLTMVTLSASTLPLPKNLGGVQVFFGPNQEQCELFYVSPNQVNFRIPPTATAGLHTVRATNMEGKSFFGDVFVAEHAPGVFTRDGTGGGAAAAAYLQFGSQTFAVLFLTGVQPERITAADCHLQVCADQRCSTTTRYLPSWIGRAPGFVGLVQVNVPLPASAVNGQGAVFHVAAWESQGFTLVR